MSLKKWGEKRIKRMGCYDMLYVKIAVAAFALMIAKLWSGILSLEWYWYLVIFIVFSIKPFYSIYCKK